MRSNIYLDANPYEVRVAVVEDGNLAELYVERKGSERIVGNIYKGVVKNVLPGMQAAFVDIGIERNAFLYAGDISVDAVDEELPEEDERAKRIPDIRKLVRVGQSIMVQVLKEPFGTKGARVTTNITLPGYKVVLLPKANYVGISRKIEDEEERTRLKTILEEIKPSHRGVIARTSALGADREELAQQIQAQMDTYQEIHAIYDCCKAPKLIHSEENIYYRTVRDAFNQDISGFYISDPQAYEYVRSLVEAVNPDLLDRVSFFDKHYDMFEYHGLESKIDKALARKVWLKSGGYLIFDSAEALTVIDVNTGKFVGTNSLQDTILKTNIEAAEEIARQIRLRDISGIIVVDFIDMEEPCNRQKILDVLREAVKRDRTRTIILGITDLGIVELTRKKTKQSLGSVFYAPCPYCEGEGIILSSESMAMKARKEVLHRFYRDGYDNVVIMAHPAVCMEINAKMRPGAQLIPSPPGKRVFLLSNTNMHIEHMEVEGVENPQEALEMGAVPLECRG
ncbi:MAG: ribonuclease E/G [Bacillota bacterium]|nr:MAG: ribonuclease E/G [Bacillota bacterium]